MSELTGSSYFAVENNALKHDNEALRQRVAELEANAERGARCVGHLRGLAHSNGWNGIENSKILHVFFDDFIGQLKQERDAANQRAAELEFSEMRWKIVFTESNTQRTEAVQLADSLTQRNEQLIGVVRELEADLFHVWRWEGMKHREDTCEVCYDWCPMCRLVKALASARAILDGAPEATPYPAQAKLDRLLKALPIHTAEALANWLDRQDSNWEPVFRHEMQGALRAYVGVAREVCGPESQEGEPIKTCSDCGVILPCKLYEHREGCSATDTTASPPACPNCAGMRKALEEGITFVILAGAPHPDCNILSALNACAVVRKMDAAIVAAGGKGIRLQGLEETELQLKCMAKAKGIEVSSKALLAESGGQQGK